jgi:hypothetical protein
MTVVLLGPQHPLPDVASVLAMIEVKGPVALITAGWQEREGDPSLVPDLGVGAMNLMLHARAEDVFAKDKEFGAAYKARQTRLRFMQDFYRVRLDHAVEAARSISIRQVDEALLSEEEKASIEMVKSLDRDHLDRLGAVETSFDARWPGEAQTAYREHRRELQDLIEGTDAIVIAGGHVASLLNRLKLFDLVRLAGHRKIVAWSAGAMALSELVVLFHDYPPHGQGRAEVLDRGLGVVPGLIVLPSAKKRLRLSDRARIRRLGDRFLPNACVTLDPGARIVVEDGRILSMRHADTLRATR